MSQSSKLLTGGSWALFKILVVQLINFAAIAILSRQLDPVDFGIVALANVALRFFNVISAQGINQFIIYDNSDEHEEKVHAAFWLNLVFSIIATLVGISLIPTISNFYQEPLLGSILLVLFFRFPVDVTSKLPDSILQKRLNFKPIEIRDTLLQLFSAIASIVMALTGFGVWSLIVPSLVVAPIRLLISLRAANWFPKFNFYTKYWGEILRYSSTIIGSTLTHFGLTQSDTLVVGKLLNTTALGVYNLSWEASNIVSRTLVTLINKLSLPAFASLKGDKEKLYQGLKKVLFAISTISFPLLMWMIVAAEYLILTIYGDKWSDAIIPFQILLIYAIRYSIGSPVGGLFKAMGRPDINLKLGLFILPFYFLGIWLGSDFGIIGVATAVTVVRTVFGFISFYLAAKLLEVSFWKVLRPVREPFLASLFASLCLWMLNEFALSEMQSFLMNPLLGVVLTGIVMTCLYIALSKFIFKEIGFFIGEMLDKLTRGKISAKWLM